MRPIIRIKTDQDATLGVLVSSAERALVVLGQEDRALRMRAEIKVEGNDYASTKEVIERYVKVIDNRE